MFKFISKYISKKIDSIRDDIELFSNNHMNYPCAIVLYLSCTISSFFIYHNAHFPIATFLFIVSLIIIFIRNFYICIKSRLDKIVYLASSNRDDIKKNKELINDIIYHLRKYNKIKDY